MSQKSLLGDFIKYVTLNILGQIAYSCYTMADTFFVSTSMGTDGLTALNLAFPVFCLMNGTGLMIGIGGGSRYSILRSGNDQKRANQSFTAAMGLAIFFSALYGLTGLLFSHPLTRMLGADETVFAPTHIYLKTLMVFAPAFLINTVLQCFIRNDGNPSLSMKAMTIGSVSNIVLDYVFIFPMGMGIFGAAFATGLSPVISMAVVMPCLLRGKNGFHFSKTRAFREMAVGIMARGVPPLMTEVSSGIVMLLFNGIILRLEGNTGVAAFGVICVISLVVVAIYTGLSQGIQPVISRNFGLGNGENVKTILKYAMVAMLLVSAVLYGVLFLYAPELAYVFNREKDMVLQEFAVPGMKIYFTACPFIGFNIVLSTYFISTDQPVPGQIISLLRSMIVLIPMAIFLSWRFGMTGVWSAYPVTELLVAGAGAALYLRAGRRAGSRDVRNRKAGERQRNWKSEEME